MFQLHLLKPEKIVFLKYFQYKFYNLDPAIAEVPSPNRRKIGLN